MPGSTAEWDRIMKTIAKAVDANVKVGVIAAKGGNETASSGSISLIELAAIHEYGAPKAVIPARSFIRSTMIKQQSVLASLKARLVGQIIAGKLTVDQALTILGTWASNEIKKTITSTDIPPPLAPKTIAAKGSAKPLVDTGRLVGAITFEVGKGK